MQPGNAARVRSKDGVCGTVVPAAPQASGDASQVLVQFETGQRLLVAADALRRQPDGSYDLPLTIAELERAHGGEDPEREQTYRVPILAEELDVQKRLVETGKVRITKVVHEREALVDEPLWRDEVDIRRVPIQRVVQEPVPVREEDGTMIIPILQEVLVVEKRLMLKEELHIRKRRVESHEPQHVTLRSEEARIERLRHPDGRET